jgi:hypothetical protein
MAEETGLLDTGAIESFINYKTVIQLLLQSGAFKIFCPLVFTLVCSYSHNSSTASPYATPSASQNLHPYQHPTATITHGH